MRLRVAAKLVDNLLGVQIVRIDWYGIVAILRHLVDLSAAILSTLRLFKHWLLGYASCWLSGYASCWLSFEIGLIQVQFWLNFFDVDNLIVYLFVDEVRLLVAHNLGLDASRPLVYLRQVH